MFDIQNPIHFFMLEILYGAYVSLDDGSAISSKIFSPLSV